MRAGEKVFGDDKMLVIVERFTQCGEPGLLRSDLAPPKAKSGCERLSAKSQMRWEMPIP